MKRIHSEYRDLWARMGKHPKLRTSTAIVLVVYLLAALLTGCAPAYYASVVYDLETTLACETCPEGNPLMPNTKSRPVLYGYSALWAAAFTVAVERLKKEKHKKVVYTVATMMRLLVGTLNLRYVNHSMNTPARPSQLCRSAASGVHSWRRK